MDTLIDAIIALAKGYASVSTIYVGALPLDESISIYNAPSGDGERYFDKTGTFDAAFTFLAKYESQKSAIGKLDAIGKSFEKLKVFPTLTDIQIYSIDYTTRVNYVEKTDDNKYIHSIVITVKIADKD